jgi:dihydroorotate dehydrogenase
MIYKNLLRPLLFSMDPERSHNMALWILKQVSQHIMLRNIVSSLYKVPDVQSKLEQRFFGLRFPNPIGLAAGFDKNGVALRASEALGFGFAEAGTITPAPQIGNDKPRMFRIPEEQAIINRMGFNNDGSLALGRTLRKVKKDVSIPIGVNIGKQKETSEEDAAKDYVTCFRNTYDFADYFVLNVSSPNTQGLRNLQNRKALCDLITRVLNEEQEVFTPTRPKPMWVKIAPDLERPLIDDIIEIALEYYLGIIATNTTIDRSRLKLNPNQTGGLSGEPLRERSLEIQRYIHTQAPSIPLIGVGGIRDSEDVINSLAAGARLVQLYTGIIYEGPGLIKKMLTEILDYMDDCKITNIIDLLHYLEIKPISITH